MCKSKFKEVLMKTNKNSTLQFFINEKFFFATVFIYLLIEESKKYNILKTILTGI
jgi:hypothetical protein